MKKIAIILAAAGAVLGLASCEQDRDPVLKMPTSYTLNVPAMQDQFIDLTPGNTIELVSSQPDYGYAAVASYSAQMSLTEDFAQSYDLTPEVSNLARMNVKQEDVAVGLMNLYGIEDDKAFAEKFPNGMDYQKIYFRAVCQIPGVEGTSITSNVVSYNNVKGYFAIPMPGFIYLVGEPEGWAGPTEGNAEHYEPWKLYEPQNAIGSHIYTGVFDIPAGSAMFRFYTALTGWDTDSYGSQEADEPLEFPDFVNGDFTSPVVKGKGSFKFPNWEGGKMTITVDMSDMKNITMTCVAGEASVTLTKYIYLVGSISGWVGPGKVNEDVYKNFRLACSDDSGIYTGSFPVTAGHINFRFALSLSEEGDGWDNPEQIGAAEPDGDVACQFTNGSYTGSYVLGKGNWAFDVDTDGTLSLTVDTNNNTVAYEFK